jgi:hypothetical protein
MLTTLAWLLDRDVLLSQELFAGPDRSRERNEGLPIMSVPATLFVPVSDRKHVAHIDPELMLPFVKIPPLTYEERLTEWKRSFGKASSKQARSLAEIARRFRFEAATIRQICAELKSLPDAVTEDDLIAACRAGAQRGYRRARRVRRTALRR